MRIEVKVPNLQKNEDEIVEGMSCPIDPELRRLQSLVTLAKWYVKDLDFAEKDTALCFIESSKASIEIPAEINGFVKILREEGTSLSAGETLCLMGDSREEFLTEGPEAPEEAERRDRSAGGLQAVGVNPSFWNGLWEKLKRVFGR